MQTSVTRMFLMDAMDVHLTKGRQAFSTDITLAGKHLENVKLLSDVLHLVTNFEASILDNLDID